MSPSDESRQEKRGVITGHDDLQKAYQDERVAREYVARRFESALGSLLHDRQVGAVTQLIRAQRIDRAVEIAPGPARVSVDVVPTLTRAMLIDASAEMLTEAGRRLDERGVRERVALVRADAFSLPLRETADLVYTFRLIRHFDRADRLRLYREIAAVLRPGGWLVFDAVNRVVSAPLRAAAKPGEFQHFDALLTPEELREELGECGFSVTALQGVQHRTTVLGLCQIYLGPRSKRLSRLAMEVIDRTGGQPLEWVVTCRRG